jgi:hypothetical protein
MQTMNKGCLHSLEMLTLPYHNSPWFTEWGYTTQSMDVNDIQILSESEGKDLKIWETKGASNRGDYKHDYHYKLTTSYYRITQVT